ncbi:pcpB, partial [Symbiodinium sp. KB8]
GCGYTVPTTVPVENDSIYTTTADASRAAIEQALAEIADHDHGDDIVVVAGTGAATADAIDGLAPGSPCPIVSSNLALARALAGAVGSDRSTSTAMAELDRWVDRRAMSPERSGRTHQMNDITAVTPDHPVVVAGAGPVGLTTALLLASRGVPVRVAERARPEVAREWRGSTLHPPTLEILDRIGLADRAIARGVRVDRLAYGDLDSDDAAVFDYGVLDGLTRYPFRLQYEQYKLLDDLRAAAADSDAIEMCWEHEIVAVSTSATQADVTIDTPTGTVRWETPLLIAADGSHSAVRSALDIGMDGSTYPTLSLV